MGTQMLLDKMRDALKMGAEDKAVAEAGDSFSTAELIRKLILANVYVANPVWS